MALTHAVSTNNYGESHLIVATSAANGTHTTLATAMADAVSGDTIFLRDSVTENVTLTAGVNITAWTGGSLNTPTITGTLTMTTAGTCNISGIRLVTNSATVVSVTGTLASIVNLDSCYLNLTNNSGLLNSSSSASSKIALFNCNGDLGTTGIVIATNSGNGTISISHSTFTNTGASTTASTASSGSLQTLFSKFSSVFTTSSTGLIISEYTTFDSSATNTASITTAGTGATNLFAFCRFLSGSASNVSVGSGTTVALQNCTFNSTNTNPIAGAGTVNLTPPVFTNTGKAVSTTTVNDQFFGRTGSFTPTLVGGTTPGTTSYTAQFGVYQKFGSLVYVQAFVNCTTGGTAAGNLVIGGLPFTIQNTTNQNPTGVCIFTSPTIPAGTLDVTVQGQLNTTTVLLIGNRSAAAAQVTQVGAATLQNVSFSMWYYV